ncbi:hypothetical protein F5H01DRAFT_324679 [Linnemannia elongata]|nr:hypothetical protein F5H01DRAFT_324679 [Linnemannia elongata]
MLVVINGYNKDFQQRTGYHLSRPTPLFLKENEKRRFKKLELFYRQIGRLVNLEILRLEGAQWNRSDYISKTPYFRIEYRMFWFPAVLSLPRSEKKWPGYLHELSGLKRLRELQESVDHPFLPLALVSQPSSFAITHEQVPQNVAELWEQVQDVWTNIL